MIPKERHKRSREKSENGATLVMTLTNFMNFYRTIKTDSRAKDSIR
jgi:hypothetical protein